MQTELLDRKRESPEVLCRLQCGLFLGVEGSVVDGFELVGWDQPDTRVEPAVVVPVGPGRGGELDIGDGLVGAGVKDRRADALGLLETVR